MLSDIALAITEAATNVVLHAYRDREEPGNGRRSRPSISSDHVCLYVRDEGTRPRPARRLARASASGSA